MKRWKIANINVDDINYKDIVSLYKESIENGKYFSVCYANAHSIVLGKRNEEFNNALNSADFVHPDGIGVYLAAKFLGMKIKSRFNWTDHAYDFLRLCESKGWSIFFLGAMPNIILSAKRNVENKYPALKLAGIKNGYSDVNKSGLIEEINNANPNILWIGMGSPKQELWIEKNKHLLNSNVVQAVGDIFSQFAGTKVRGPLIIRKLGFEWLARLIIHPVTYSQRYIWGIPIFVFMVIKEKFKR